MPLRVLLGALPLAAMLATLSFQRSPLSHVAGCGMYWGSSCHFAVAHCLARDAMITASSSGDGAILAKASKARLREIWRG